MITYENKGFDDGQMYEIRWGVKNKLDVSIYAKKEFDWFKMRHIRIKLERGKGI